jgi:hypothetical protein
MDWPNSLRFPVRKLDKSKATLEKASPSLISFPILPYNEVRKQSFRVSLAQGIRSRQKTRRGFPGGLLENSIEDFRCWCARSDFSSSEQIQLGKGAAGSAVSRDGGAIPTRFPGGIRSAAYGN